MYIVISKTTCGWCAMARHLLTEHGHAYIDFYLDRDDEDDGVLTLFIKSIGLKTVPQIFYGTKHIGGYEDLKLHLEKQDDDDAQIELAF